MVNTTDWSNIPHYPTTRERRENVAKYLMQMGRQVPPELLRKIQEDKQREIQEDVFNNHLAQREEEEQQEPPPPVRFVQQPRVYRQPHFGAAGPPRPPPPPPNKYSPQYAAYVGARPRAQASAKVRLGGVY